MGWFPARCLLLGSPSSCKSTTGIYHASTAHTSMLDVAYNVFLTSADAISSVPVFYVFMHMTLV